MIVNAETIEALLIGFKTSFNGGLAAAPSAYKEIATVVPSKHREEHYGWLGQFPFPREWIGPRHIHSLSLHGYAIKNKLFESTIEVSRVDIEDDTFGVYGPIATEMGRACGELPDEVIFSLLKDGFTTLCYDGQNFFDADHPVELQPGVITSVSNMQSGDGPAWFLLDTSRAIKPLLYQERIPFVLTSLDKDGDRNVFFNDTYIYGTRGRANAGVGLWQLAFASKAALTAANYEAARLAMHELKGDGGRRLGITPTLMVVPPELEGPAMRLLNNGTRIEVVGETPIAIQNEWANTAKLLVSRWLV